MISAGSTLTLTCARLPSTCGVVRGRRRDRDIFERLHGIDLVLRHLHGHVVFDAVRGIHPERRIDLEARAQREEQAIGHVLLAQADGLRAGAVDIQEHRGRGEQLLHVDVHRAGNLLDAAGDLLRDPIIGAACSGPMSWMSIGAGTPKFRIWLTMSAG